MGLESCPRGRCAPRHTRQSPAFTLIEVLVVVAIIALLVSILIPSLSRARAISRRTVCMSGLSQLGKGMTVYAMEQNDYLPMPLRIYQGRPVVDVGPIPHSQRNMYGAQGIDDMSSLFPRYVRDLKAWECPSARNVVRNAKDLEETYQYATEPRYGSAYEYFPFMYGALKSMTTGRPSYGIDGSGTIALIRWSRLKRASSVVVDFDNNNLPPNNELNEGEPHWELRGANQGCADGHVQFVRAEVWNADPMGRPVVNP